jgi:hypothetical protein
MMASFPFTYRIKDHLFISVPEERLTTRLYALPQGARTRWYWLARNGTPQFVQLSKIRHFPNGYLDISLGKKASKVNVTSALIKKHTIPQ